MSYCLTSDHTAWQQRVRKEHHATQHFNQMMATGGFTEPSDPFYRDWKKKFYATKNMFTFTTSPQ